MHIGMWMLSYLVRMGVPLTPDKYTKYLLKLSNLFDRFGTDTGGMHMLIKGIDTEDKPLDVQWFLVAMEGAGPQIPCTPSVILARKLLNNEITVRGAMPCVGLITLEEYLNELKHMPIKQHEFINK